MRHGSLFSGIGGFDLAAEWMGWENVFHCEWNEFGQKVLKHYWPKAISYNDITKTDFTIHRGDIDIITGGFPCQPFSQVGSRKGTDDHRYLWPEMCRAIREIQPSYVVGENVPGLIDWNEGMVLDTIKTDLEAAGYEVFPPVVLGAVSVNAIHKRRRVFIIAHANSDRDRIDREQEGKKDSLQGKYRQAVRPRDTYRAITEYVFTNANSQGLQGGEINGSTTEKWKVGNEHALRFFPPIYEEFPTEPPLCGNDDGVSCDLDGITFSKWRTESVKGYGNAVFPPLIYEIFKTIQKYDTRRKG